MLIAILNYPWRKNLHIPGLRCYQAYTLFRYMQSSSVYHLLIDQLLSIICSDWLKLKPDHLCGSVRGDRDNRSDPLFTLCQADLSCNESKS